MSFIESEREHSPAEIASTLFAQVSRDYPASISFQSMAIAQECETRGLNPEILGIALITDDQRMEKLRVTANAVHTHRDVTVNGKPVEPLILDLVENVIASDFYLAARAMQLHRVEKQQFLNLFPTYKKIVDLVDRNSVEKRYRNGLVAFIDKRQSRYKYPIQPGDRILALFSLRYFQKGKNI